MGTPGLFFFSKVPRCDTSDSALGSRKHAANTLQTARKLKRFGSRFTAPSIPLRKPRFFPHRSVVEFFS